MCMLKHTNHQQKETSLMNMGTLKLSIVEVYHIHGVHL